MVGRKVLLVFFFVWVGGFFVASFFVFQQRTSEKKKRMESVVGNRERTSSRVVGFKNVLENEELSLLFGEWSKKDKRLVFVCGVCVWCWCCRGVVYADVCVCWCGVVGFKSVLETMNYQKDGRLVFMWCCGVVVLCMWMYVLWCCGVVVLWCCGVVVLWCCVCLRVFLLTSFLLKKKKSYENYSFYKEVEEYKKTTQPNEIQSKAQHIFEKYFSMGSEWEVNYDFYQKKELEGWCWYF